MADPPTDYSTSPEVPQSPSFTSSSSTSVPSSPPPPSSLTTTAGDALKAEDSPLEDIDLDRSPVIPQAEREDVDDTTSFPPKPSRPTTTTTPSTRFNAVDASSLPPTPPPKPSPPPLHSTSTPMARVPSQTPAVVHAVLLVSFDHALGPIVEFAHPPVFRDNEELNKNLPFLALPDGAHLREEDYSYFHLLLPTVAPGTVFGISCNRQIQSDELINKGKDVTRSTVQKAIVVLASKPIFGPLRDKLGVITRTFFAQRDFEDKSILVDLFSSLEIHNAPTAEEESPEQAGMYMGTSLRELVYRFRTKTLMLLKLLLLQRRTMFYSGSSPVESLCTFQYSLVALIPALLTHLEDAASPELDERSQRFTQPTSLRTSDKASLIRYLGLPLNIFGKGAFFQPYLPLQQIDLLKTRSFLVGTTNSIFQQQRDCPIDVIVRAETGTLDILDPKLSPLLALTAADRKWMDEIVSTVEGSYNVNDPSRPVGLNFVGSEDFLRAKFEEYICSLLACIKFTDYLKKGDRHQVLLSSGELESYNMTSFNESFVKAFKATPAFEAWDRTTDEVIFDLVEPKHPMEGKTNPIEDVGIRLAQGLHDLHLQENLAPTREAISRGINSGSESIWGAYSFLRSDISKRQREFNERRASQIAASTPGESIAPNVGGGTATSSPSQQQQQPNAVLDLAPPIIGTTLLAGVDVAKTGAASLATGIGSFLSSRRQMFAPKTTPPASRSNSPAPPPPPGAVDVTPTSTTSTSPLPSPGFASFLRPLSTAPMANNTGGNVSNGPANAAVAAAGGFFGTLRRSFSEAVPTPSSNVGGGGGAGASPPTKSTATMPKALELADPALSVRDLDAEFAAREKRAERRRTLREEQMKVTQ